MRPRFGRVAGTATAFAPPSDRLPRSTEIYMKALLVDTGAGPSQSVAERRTILMRSSSSGSVVDLSAAISGDRRHISLPAGGGFRHPERPNSCRVEGDPRAKAAAHDPGTWFRRLHAAISKHQTSHAGVSVRRHRRSSDAGRTADAARSPVETAPVACWERPIFIAPR